MLTVTKYQSFIASVQISIPEVSDSLRTVAVENVLPKTLDNFHHPLGLERVKDSQWFSNSDEDIYLHFVVPVGMTTEHINEGARILRSNFVSDLSDYLLGNTMKNIEKVRLANGLYRPETTQADSAQADSLPNTPIRK